MAKSWIYKEISYDEFRTSKFLIRSWFDIFPKFLRDRNDIYIINKKLDFFIEEKKVVGYKLQEAHSNPDFDW